VDDEQWEKKVLPAITTYKQVHGTLQVPRNFVVPSSGEWEEGLWNMRLGEAVHSIRFCAQAWESRKELQQLCKQ
jgi:hypothetical protein